MTNSTSVSEANDQSRASLYDRLGGMPAIRAVLDDYTERILADPRVNPWFAHAAVSPERAEAYKAMYGSRYGVGAQGTRRH
jgi:truncated hemoglobin YjbI